MELFSFLSIGITILFNLHWIFPLPHFWGMILGSSLLCIGCIFLFCSLKTLSIKRAFGREIYKSKSESKLITTGIYKYTRNSLYLRANRSFFGWFFLLLLTFMLILTLFFIVLWFFVGK